MTATETTPLKAAESPARAAGPTFSLQDGLLAVGMGRYQVVRLMFACGVACYAEAAEGMLMPFLIHAARNEWNLSQMEGSWTITMVFLGQLLGGPVWGLCADKWGRKRGYLISMTFMFVFALASAASQEYWHLLLFRFLVGFGIAGAVSAFALYSEFITVARGRIYFLASLFGFWTLGSVFEAVLAYLTLDLGWRWFLVLSSTPILLAILVYPILPESPRWLAKKRRFEEAQRILVGVAKWNKRKLPEGKLYEERSVLARERMSIVELFSGEWGVTTVILMFLNFAMCLCYYGLSIYTVDLMSTSTDGRNEALNDQDYLDIVVTTLSELPGLLVMIIVVEVLGRRFGLGIGMFAAGVPLIAVAIPYVQRTQWLMTVLLFFARGGLTGCFDLLYIYEMEVYPTAARATAIGFIFSAARLGGLVSGQAVEITMQAGRMYPGVLLGSLSVVAGIICCFLPRETKGMELVERFGDKAVKSAAPVKKKAAAAAATGDPPGALPGGDPPGAPAGGYGTAVPSTTPIN